MCKMTEKIQDKSAKANNTFDKKGAKTRKKDQPNISSIDVEYERAIKLVKEEKYKLAIKYFERVLDAVLGFEEHVEIEADIKYQLALIYKLQEQYDEAMTHARDALRIRQNAGDITKVIEVKYLIASIHREEEEYEEALEIYNDAYEKACSEYGDTDYRVLMARFWIARVLMKQGDKREALEHLEYVYVHFRHHFDEDHEQVKIVRFFMKRVKQRNNCQCYLM